MTDYLVYINANRSDGKLAAIHISGCPVASRDFTPGTHIAGVTGTLRDALDVAVDPDDRDLGYDDSDAHIHNCAKG